MPLWAAIRGNKYVQNFARGVRGRRGGAHRTVRFCGDPLGHDRRVGLLGRRAAVFCAEHAVQIFAGRKGAQTGAKLSQRGHAPRERRGERQRTAREPGKK